MDTPTTTTAPKSGRVNQTSGHPNSQSINKNETKELTHLQVERSSKSRNQVDGIELVELGGRAPFIFLGPPRKRHDSSGRRKEQQQQYIPDSGQQTRNGGEIGQQSFRQQEQQKQRRIKFRRKFSSLTAMVKLKNWLPLIQLSLLAIQSTPPLIKQARCDDQSLVDHQMSNSQSEQQTEELLRQLESQTSDNNNNNHNVDDQTNNQLQNELISRLQNQLSRQVEENQQQTGSGSEDSTLR